MTRKAMTYVKTYAVLLTAVGFLTACQTLPADVQIDASIKGSAAISGKTLPSGPPFSPVIEAGGVYYLAGHLGRDPETREYAPNIAAQTTRTLQNIDATLKTVGSGLYDVVRCQVFMTDITGFAEMNNAYRQFFPQNPPARTTVEVSGLAAPNALIEIECTAVPEQTSSKKAK